MITNTLLSKKIERVSIAYVIFLSALSILLLYFTNELGRTADALANILGREPTIFETLGIRSALIFMILINIVYLIHAILLYNELNSEKLVKVLRSIRWLFDAYGITKEDFKNCISKKKSRDELVSRYKGFYAYIALFEKHTYKMTRWVDNRWTNAFLLYSTLLFRMRMRDRISILNDVDTAYFFEVILCDAFHLHFKAIEKIEFENIEKLESLINSFSRQVKAFEIPYKPGPLDEVQDVLRLLGYQNIRDKWLGILDTVSLSYIDEMSQICPKIAPQAIYCIIKESQNRYRIEYLESEFALLSIDEDAIQSHECQMMKMKDLLSMRHNILSYIGGADPRKIKVVLLGFDELEAEFIQKFSKK